MLFAKVGFTAHPMHHTMPMRLRYTTYYGPGVRIGVCFSATRKLEAQLHRQFRAFAISNELYSTEALPAITDFLLDTVGNFQMYEGWDHFEQNVAQLMHEEQQEERECNDSLSESLVSARDHAVSSLAEMLEKDLQLNGSGPGSMHSSKPSALDSTANNSNSTTAQTQATAFDCCESICDCAGMPPDDSGNRSRTNVRQPTLEAAGFLRSDRWNYSLPADKTNLSRLDC